MTSAICSHFEAGATGLEPATSGVTVRGSITVNPCILDFLWLIGHRQVTVSIFECVGGLTSGNERKHRPEIIPHKTDIAGPGSRIDLVPRLPTDRPPNSTVVLTNPNEDCSPAAFRAFLDELLSGPEPELDSLDAAETLRELRVDGKA